MKSKKQKASLTRVKITYDASDGHINNVFESDMIPAIKAYGLVYDGSGMNLETRTRDLFFYAPKKKEGKQNESHKV